MNTSGAERGKLGLYIMLGAVLFAVILIGGGVGAYFFLEWRKDTQAYERAEAGGGKSHFEAYLTEFPNGSHVRKAHLAIDELDWQAAPKNVAGYLAYLKLHPRGLHASEAREKADDLAWDSLSRRGSVLALEEYLETFPEGRNAQQAKALVEKTLACNRAYARAELAKVGGLEGLVDAGAEGASNLYSRRQGAAYSTTHYSGNTATTYHHDGSYTSQDGVEIRYRVSNSSKFLIYERVEGEVSFRTKAGVFWRGVVGGWLGAAVGASRDPENGLKDGAVAGAKKAYEMASHKEKVVITQPLGPGETYNGRAYLRAKYKVLNSDFKAEKIHAIIAEPLLKQKIAPGC